FVRVLGWALLVPVAAVTADIVPLPLEEAPLSGGGGSLGACLHATLEANCPDSLGLVVLAGAGLLGVAFAANFALRPLARLGWRLLCGLATFTWKGIRSAVSFPKKSDAAPRELRSLTLAARQPKSKNETPVDDSIPINYPDSAAGAETAPRPNAALVPIQRS